MVVFMSYLNLHGQPSRPEVDLKTFVTREYIHGLPYDEAKLYGVTAVPALLLMLNNPDFERFWGNIVAAIGYIGNPSATKPLLEFIQSQEGEISVDRFRAVLSAFQALGHIAQSGDRLALTELANYNNLNSWKEKKLAFSYGIYKREALSEVLSRQAIQGLGISGRPEAYRILSEMSKRKDLRKDWIDNVNDAMSLNEKVKMYGARKLFGKEI